MQPGIMITNGGPHPADKYAAVAASQIAELIQVDEASESPEAKAARRAKPRFELDLADALEKHHQQHIDDEREALRTLGAERYDHPLAVPDTTLQDAVDAVAEAAKGTPFEAHFAEPRVRDAVLQIVGQHMATSMHVERAWHADRA